MSKIVSEEWVEARKALLEKEKIYVNVAVVAALVMEYCFFGCKKEKNND
jgi:hypothetical protein